MDIFFETIWAGDYWSCACDSTTAAVFMFADEGSWSSFWEGSLGLFSPPPVVDFEHEVVLALLDKVEPRSTGVEIESVRREMDRIVVRATRRTGCWEMWFPTPPFRPYHFVRINRRLAPVDLLMTDIPCR